MKNLRQFIVEAFKSNDERIITFNVDNEQDVENIKKDLQSLVDEMCKKYKGSFERWEFFKDSKELNLIVSFNSDSSWHDFLETFCVKVNDKFPDYTDKLDLK